MAGGWIIVQPASTMMALVQNAAYKYDSLHQQACAFVHNGGNTRSATFKALFAQLYKSKYEYSLALFARCVNTELLKFFLPGGNAAPAQYEAAAMNANCYQQYRPPPAPNSKMWWASPPAMALTLALQNCNSKTGSMHGVY